MQGQGGGKSVGGGSGKGRGMGQGGKKGRMGGVGGGPGGNCVCTQCGKTVSHQQGVPCNSLQCPECGAQMTRQM